VRLNHILLPLINVNYFFGGLGIVVVRVLGLLGALVLFLGVLHSYSRPSARW